MWTADAEALVARQHELEVLVPETWEPPIGGLCVGACWVCFPRGYSGPGDAGGAAHAAAVVVCDGRLVDRAVRTGVAGAPYTPGLLALRLGPLLGDVTRALPRTPDGLLVAAPAETIPDEPGSRCTSVPSSVGPLSV